jgi:hypothetical protein
MLLEINNMKVKFSSPLRGRIPTLLLLVLLGAQGATARDTQLLWGDTHLHTSNSFDVYLFGTATSTPDNAYRFAKGQPVINPVTGTRWQLSTPLDFLVVADHAEALGAIPRVFADDPVVADTKTGKIIRAMAPEQADEDLQAVYLMMQGAGSGRATEQGLTAKDIYLDIHAGDKRSKAWEDYIDTAERHNTPGEFTALIGWEWTAQPNGGNQHRVVFTPDDAATARKFLPYSQLESENEEDLWAWLDKTSRDTGARFVAIPHNPNLSIGQMFPLLRYNGQPVDADYARRRMMWEPVAEVTQIKGDSEAHPLLSPTDEYADYETYSFIMVPEGGIGVPNEGDYLRSGLRRGLEFKGKTGANPFKVGMIGSTDSHTGISAVEENNFAGKGQHDARPGQRPNPVGIGSARGWDMGAAGYAGVWAEENTREAITDAFKRKEVYATTGPRIRLRFFGGFDFREKDARARDIAVVGYSKGVPMGGDLRATGDKAPCFLLAASKDPLEANLDRIQIVKGWVDSAGQSHEKIYDVALSDGRTDGSVKVGSTVDLESGKYTNTIGAEQLSAVWTDPEFDPSQDAFYYARVLQIPTPRYSLIDSIALGTDWQETGRPATIQERAYSSPIWFEPE